MWREYLEGKIESGNTRYENPDTCFLTYVIETPDRKKVSFIGTPHVGLLFETQEFKGFYSPIGGGVIFEDLPWHLRHELLVVFSEERNGPYYYLGRQVPSLAEDLISKLDNMDKHLGQAQQEKEKITFTPMGGGGSISFPNPFN